LGKRESVNIRRKVTKITSKEQLQIVLTIVVSCCLALTACSTSTSSENLERGNNGEDLLSDLNSLSPVELAEGEVLRVVATTNIVGDVVSNVGGTAIELTTLIPLNADPHAYQPTPADFRAVSDAHIVFINGLGLEAFLEEMVRNVGGDTPVVSLSEGIDPLIFGEHEEDAHEDAEEDSDHGDYDPHVWFDPTNVMIWTERVAQALAKLDPGNSVLYERNAENYKSQLQDLDEWIFEKVSQIPIEERRLVTDHRVFDYFAARYGFEVLGAVIPVYSSAAEPSAQEIAELEVQVRNLGIQTLFVGVSVNPNVVQALVEDTGIKMVPLYTGSLSEPTGPAGSYIAFMKFNVESIVNALSE
jgi:ABC-type Zn uptake system ZnuABC Zn-binding protein ZnuA